MSKTTGKEKAVVPKEDNSTAALTDALSMASLAGTDEADSGDIIVPRILLMQGTSKQVPDLFQQGEIINSLEERALGGRGTPVEIIPFALSKTWEEFKDKTKTESVKWFQSYKWNASNDDIEWKFVNEDGESCFRQKQYAFYCFVVSDMIGFPIPCLVSFRSSSGFKEGKKIASHFSVMKGLNQPGHNIVWSLDSVTVKDGGNSYQKFVIKKVRETTAKEVDTCNKWLDIITNQKANVRVQDEADDASTTAQKETASDHQSDHIPF